MKAGTENRKKMITAGALGTVAIICLGYAYNQIFGGPSAPPPTPTTPTVQSAISSSNTSRTNVISTTASGRSSSNTNTAGPGAIPGVAAQRIATTSSSLDPTLDQTAMLRTESLVYSGSGRNIFSATYTPPAAKVDIPKEKFPARPVQPVYTPPAQTDPPPPPPINLKFFGTATRANGQRQAFLLQGDDVYLASSGDIVARKYKIGNITLNSVQVTDLQNNNTQNLPYQSR